MISKRQRYDSGQYAVLPKAVINESTLSFGARGLLIYLLEKPADWTVSNEALYRQSPAGERHINTLLSELKAAGYVHREKVYDPPTRTFRWDTIVYDFPEDNPEFDPARIPTFCMDTKRMDTKRNRTKRSDDLILKEPNDINTRAQAEPTVPEPTHSPLPEPTQRRGRSERLTGPSQMELEGYSPEPPTAASRAVGAPPLPEASYLRRLPGTLERMGLDPARMREMAQLQAGELSVPGIYSGDRGRAFTHGASYPMYLWMLNVLALVCGENLTSGESTTLAEPLWRTAREWVDEGRTPPQLWARFGDPEGYWYASEDHGWKGKRPTVTDVGRKWRAAGESWARRTAGTPAAAGGAKEAAADDGSDGAWAAVMKAISRYGRYRQTEILDALDEITRAAVRAVSLSRLMDVDPDDGRGLRDTRRMFTAEYREQRRRLDGRTQMVAQAAD